VLNCITALHTSKPASTEPAYPHLRTLLSFDTREFFNVLSLAFDDAADMTCDKKQRIVDILLLLMVDGVGFSPAQVCSAVMLILPDQVHNTIILQSFSSFSALTLFVGSFDPYNPSPI